MSLGTLHYFPVRGRAEIVRLVLEAAKQTYEDKHHNPETLGALKASGQLPFGQVPFWVGADGFALAQTNSIARYLGKQFGLNGSNEKEEALISMVLEGYNDFLAKLTPLVFPQLNKEGMIEFIRNNNPTWVKFFENIIEKHGSGGYTIGSKLSVADIAVFLLIEAWEMMKVDLSAYPHISKVKSSVVSNEGIAAFISSGRRLPARSIDL